MNTRLLNDLKERIDLIPTCSEYAELLDYAVKQTGKNRYELFENQGWATYAEWADFLGIKAN